MMVYAESSAVLAWLLGEKNEKRIREILTSSDRILSSALTSVECGRALARARSQQRITRIEELVALRLLDVAAASWDVLELSQDVLLRARAPFPLDEIRTLDALHVASASVLREQLAVPIDFLSLDDRVRRCALGMGFNVVPETA